MENANLIGLSRLTSLERELGVIANNVANTNTNGFKADGQLFEQFLMPVARDDGFAGADRQMHFVQDRGTWLDMSPGTFQQTGNPLDVAIDGHGFLVVQTANGKEAYTRNGALQINSAGELVTSQGDKVMGDSGPIVFQKSDRDIVINPDGTIQVGDATIANSDSARGKLRVVKFANEAGLQKQGANLFTAPAGVSPGPVDANTHIVQGAVEKSNVQGVLAMTRMVEVTRSYADIAALMQQQDSTRKDAINRLAEVPA